MSTGLLGGLSPHLVAAHIAAVTAAVPSRKRRRRSNAGAWIVTGIVVALIGIRVVS